jgi:DNA invertase Pin-like site-specific DNA recombinase
VARKVGIYTRISRDDEGDAMGVARQQHMVAFANKSSHDASRRISRKHLELAQQGKDSGPPAGSSWRMLGLPSRTPSTQAEPSRRGPWRTGWETGVLA